MPWTPKQRALLLSDMSPLKPEQKAKMKAELHADPTLATKKKGSPALKKKPPGAGA